jgi:VWFA-related protein
MLHELPHTLAHRLAPAFAPVLAFVLLAAADPAAAAPKERDEPEVPPIVDEIRVDVVNVDVVVTDKDGNPVPGLTPEDFVLYEDSQRREITNFYSFVDGRATEDGVAAEAEASSDAEAWPESPTRRRMVILFDNQSLESRDRRRAIEAVERFILEQFDGTYEWAVVAYGSEVQLVEPFTDDKTRVLASLAKVDRLPVPVRRAHAWDRTFTEDRPLVARNQGFGSRAGIDQGPGPRGLTTREFELRDRMMSGLQTLSYTTAALVQTMRAYSAVPGRKSLLLITGTMDMIPGAAQLFGRGLPGVGSENRTDPVSSSVHADVLRRFELIVKIANAAGFAIYPMSNSSLIDAHASQLEVERQLSMSFNGSASAAVSDIDIESAPSIMAAGTGGRFFSTSKFYDAISEVDYQTANSYVLGFQTTREPDSRYHKLKVHTKFSGLTLRHREGYIHLSREARLLEELSTPLVFPKNQGDFQVAMEVMRPESTSEKDVTLTVAGQVPISDITLIPRGDSMVGRVDLFLAIYDRDGKLVNLLRDRQDIEIPTVKIEQAATDAPARFGIKVRDLKRGDYTFTLTLLDAIGERHGTGLQAVAL